MIKDFWLSAENCKQLKDWECEIESEKRHSEWVTPDTIGNYVNTYHLLEDICCNHAIEFFGERKTDCLGCKKKDVTVSYTDCTIICDECESPNLFSLVGYRLCTDKILKYLQQNKKEEAEKYFMKKTIFNPCNK